VTPAGDPARDPAALLALAAEGNRVALARLLSMIERGGAGARGVATHAYRGDVPYTLGLTGAPGSGKSTLTDRLIGAARQGWPPPDGNGPDGHRPDGNRPDGNRPDGDGPDGDGPVGDRPDGDGVESVDQVAVLAIDPSSPFTGGAILGDRVRMQEHALDPTVFIRSMATRGHLGGLALAVPDAIRLLGAAGMPVVLLETVGVGQMEVEVAGQADTTVVVVTPGWGDAMQANKAGLLEVADLFVINKADRPGVAEARRDLEQMLDWSPPSEWRPPIVETSATKAEGIDGLWRAVADHRRFLRAGGRLEGRRADRLTQALKRVVAARVEVRVERLGEGASFDDVVKQLVAGECDPYEAADRLLGEGDGPPEG
jgi:LAO/AO transport system kinase